jgi:2-polyprenyl-3-methyl-5-hydroxy-6-metoxy-1,4-benzoquinol methylase
MTPPTEDDLGTYDVVFIRFVLTHLPDPAVAVANATARLAPGGALIVEDIDFRGHFCVPAVDEHYAAARDDDVLLSLPRIVQTWGRRA